MTEEVIVGEGEMEEGDPVSDPEPGNEAAERIQRQNAVSPGTEPEARDREPDQHTAQQHAEEIFVGEHHPGGAPAVDHCAEMPWYFGAFDGIIVDHRIPPIQTDSLGFERLPAPAPSQLSQTE